MPLLFYIYFFFYVLSSLSGRVPWSGLSPGEVRAEMRRGRGLPLDRATTPPHLYHLMRLGLLPNNSSSSQDQLLDLQEIRDMLLFTRVSSVNLNLYTKVKLLIFVKLFNIKSSFLQNLARIKV